MLVLCTAVPPSLSVGLASSHEPQSKLSPVEPDELDTLEALDVDPQPSAGTGGFLDADEAFVLSVTARDAHTIELRWRIADTYYLYRNRFGFFLAPDAASGGVAAPADRRAGVSGSLLSSRMTAGLDLPVSGRFRVA